MKRCASMCKQIHQKPVMLNILSWSIAVALVCGRQRMQINNLWAREWEATVARCTGKDRKWQNMDASLPGSKVQSIKKNVNIFDTWCLWIIVISGHLFSTDEKVNQVFMCDREDTHDLFSCPPARVAASPPPGDRCNRPLCVSFIIDDLSLAGRSCTCYNWWRSDDRFAIWSMNHQIQGPCCVKRLILLAPVKYCFSFLSLFFNDDGKWHTHEATSNSLQGERERERRRAGRRLLWMHLSP